MITIFLALGSNQGDKAANLKSALKALSLVGESIEISSVYETKAKYVEDQENFYNMVCKLNSELSILDFFRSTKTIEKQLGRIQTFRNGPRVIDIDILFADDTIIESDELTIPHIGISERAFVLIPLAEIAAEVKIPKINTSANTLLKKLDKLLIDEVKMVIDKSSVL